MRILFSTWPAHGHLLPLLPLLRAAQRAGHDVVLASGAEGAAEASRRGIAVWDVGPSRAEADAAFRADPPDLGALPPDQRMPTVIRGMFGAAAPQRAAALVPLAEQWRPDLVIHPITELAGAIAAERTGARHAVHGLGPLPAEAWEWFGARFGALCADWDVPGLEKAIVERPYLDNNPPLLQSDAVAAFRNRLPLRPEAGEPAGPDETLPWTAEQLDALPYDRTLHLTLGTLFHGATGVFETALAGLRRLPVNVLVTVGPGTDPGRLGPQPPQVLVADFAPHALLLPRCAGLVTQGGAGTIVAALCHGLPHLILPQGADQFVNGAAAERAGVALVLPPPELTADAVEEAARRLLDDPALTAAAHEARDEIAALPAPDAVLEMLTR
ncbi:UDP:flavonoid glycosyltransferase YjiC, YdhE family [Cryptosporangium aurantiacum]|uniref:UDP:flavonoid glycosyltransferase YjiC, YdhE family n=2 Tax=Cryptosporangium aurantiacum TaxID=134849 RepID=A0A1M7RJP0_9ACTN|nr:UDP:flavonoid glycosyltransferase YjiC, YdhE family [Cryptosporangium aurantiacum]